MNVQSQISILNSCPKCAKKSLSKVSEKWNMKNAEPDTRESLKQILI